MGVRPGCCVANGRSARIIGREIVCAIARRDPRGEAMTVWWYAEKNSKVGPVDLNQLKQLLQAGRINAATFVWREGGDDWRPLSEIEELSSLRASVPPPVPRPRDLDPLTLPLASRWPRFFARLFDLWWETLAVSYAVGWTYGRYSASFVEWINQPGSGQLFGLMCIPVGLVLDAGIYRVFGNTPGKSFMGLRVATLDARPLTFAEYLTRNYTMWISGLAFGFPLINLITMVAQSRRLEKGQQASYDESTGYRVRSRPIGTFRRLAFAFSFIGLFAIVAVMNAEGQRTTREVNEGLLAPPFSWENPITRLATKVDSRWKPTKPPSSDGQDVFFFSERADRAVVILAIERGDIDLADYVRAFQDANRAAMRFPDGGRYFDRGGNSTWEALGSQTENPDFRIRVQVTKYGAGFWRVVSLQAQPYAYSDAHVDALRSALWTTVK